MRRELTVSDIVEPGHFSESGIPGFTRQANYLGDTFIGVFNKGEVGIVVEVRRSPNPAARVLTSAGKLMWINESYVKYIDVPDDV